MLLVHCTISPPCSSLTCYIHIQSCLYPTPGLLDARTTPLVALEQSWCCAVPAPVFAQPLNDRVCCDVTSDGPDSHGWPTNNCTGYPCGVPTNRATAVRNQHADISRILVHTSCIFRFFWPVSTIEASFRPKDSPDQSEAAASALT